MLTFQEVILRLQRYWADQGTLIWQPYSEKVGAGTMNPATITRVLGPEPWNVAYTEPSYRPDDGRYADNPNRMQMHTQMQVILKPDPGDPQERYLKSLEALGIQREEHDIRFVEDNWESPALGAWGLGWEVWLDGQEITQFTYFQQAGGVTLEIPSVEITYGLERIVMYLQNVRSVWDIAWDNNHTYGEILRDQEIDHCRYDFEYADVGRLQSMYELYEEEALFALNKKLVVPALDYILRCSHTFNLLDARGTIGVTERAVFFKRMRELARKAAEAYLEQRERAEYPWLNTQGLVGSSTAQGALMHLPLRECEDTQSTPTEGYGSFLLEIGTEELPHTHLNSALKQLRKIVPAALADARLEHGAIHTWGTPRRISVFVEELILRQEDEERVIKGPPASRAYDADGNPTRAAQGFARSKGVKIEDLKIDTIDGGEYVVAQQKFIGKSTQEVLSDTLAQWISKIRFPRSMRWNESGVAFSRPIRWLVALLGENVVPFTYAGLKSSRVTRGPRPSGSPEVALASALDYKSTLNSYGIIIDVDARREAILKQAQDLAATVGGSIPDDPKLLDEVTNLVEVPTALLGTFEKRHLALPQDMLIAVMKKHQRYFPVLDARGRIMAHFITIRNGSAENLDIVRQGNEDVIRARYADAEFFYTQDCQHPLRSYIKKLDALTFQAELGSMLDKTQRLEAFAPWIGIRLRIPPAELDALKRASKLAKADLATKMVVEMTSLQGIMGREYAQRSGEPPAVTQAISEHYLPRSAGDKLPESLPGIVLGMADRFDSLAGLFAVGMAPTGSADPFGLRRTAAGVIQILLAHNISLSIREMLTQATRTLPVSTPPEALEAAIDFVQSRLQVLLREQGFAFDVVTAVLAARGENPALARKTVIKLARWVIREDWPLLLDNYARCVRITRDKPRFTLKPELLIEDAEKALYKQLKGLEPQITPNCDIDTFLTKFQPLIPAIQRFFDDVLVMAEDETLKETRLALLQNIADLTKNIVDLSKLEGF